MKLVLIGIQGAGKSTQGNLLSEQLGIPYLSTGHIFRKMAREKTELGRYIKEVMNTGLLIPDDKTIEIVEQYLSRREYQKGYILDGFPRTIKQAEIFKNNVDHVVYINLPEREALWRISHRNDTSRADENLAGIRKRIDLFKKLTTPVVDYYMEKGKLVEVDGTKSISRVNSQILQALGKQVVKNELKDWKPDKKTIIAIVGLYGSGKSEASAYFSQKKSLPIVSFGAVINEYIDSQGLPHNEEIHKKVRMELREQHGMEALAILNLKKIDEALKKHDLMIIDGMRSWEEYQYLKRNLPDVRLEVVLIWAPKEDRLSRIAKRKVRSTHSGDDRDMNEVISANMGPTLALADHVVINHSTVEDFHSRLENVYRAIYFS